MTDLLHGAIDCHVHSFPDIIKRRLDDLELVEQAAPRYAGPVLVSCQLLTRLPAQPFFPTSAFRHQLNDLWVDQPRTPL